MIPTTPIPVTPYPYHCEYGTAGRGMEGVNLHHCHHILVITIPLLQDGAQGCWAFLMSLPKVDIVF